MSSSGKKIRMKINKFLYSYFRYQKRIVFTILFCTLFIQNVFGNIETRKFNRLDLKKKIKSIEAAVLLYGSDRADVWIYKDIYQKQNEGYKLNLHKDAKNIVQEFESKIISAISNIIELPNNLNKIEIIFDDIDDVRDTHGFYSPEFLGKDVILLDINYEWRGLKTVYSILAHEFFHCIQYYYDPDEMDFVKEGTAQLIERYLYKHLHYDTVVGFLKNANNALMDFKDTKNDYANSYLFFDYLLGNFGGKEMLRDLILEQKDGIDGINEVLSKRQVEFNGDNLDFTTAFILYSIALSTNAGKKYYKLPSVIGPRSKNIKMEKELSLPPYSSKYFKLTTKNLEKANNFDHPVINSWFVGVTRFGRIKAFKTRNGLLLSEARMYKRLSWVLINSSDIGYLDK